MAHEHLGLVSLLARLLACSFTCLFGSLARVLPCLFATCLLAGLRARVLACRFECPLARLARGVEFIVGGS